MVTPVAGRQLMNAHEYLSDDEPRLLFLRLARVAADRSGNGLVPVDLTCNFRVPENL
jgi:hypothetical protein